MIERILHLLQPLADFYESSGSATPRIEPLDGAEMPSPYRELLVHDSDMTPTLERYAGEDLRLNVLQHREQDNVLYRQVTLVRRSDRRPVEFGAIRIHLTHFSDDIAALIREGRLPLGRILQEHAVPHRCHPDAFFRFGSEPVITRAFALTEPVTDLFGRHSRLSFADGVWLAEAVEILPPLPAGS